MRGNVVVDTESDYQTWLQKQQTFAQLSTVTTRLAAATHDRGEMTAGAAQAGGRRSVGQTIPAR
jgi:heme/copper-type cytochrome/quinol oxidase subunit 2